MNGIACLTPRSRLGRTVVMSSAKMQMAITRTEIRSTWATLSTQHSAIPITHKSACATELTIKRLKRRSASEPCTPLGQNRFCWPPPPAASSCNNFTTRTHAHITSDNRWWASTPPSENAAEGWVVKYACTRYSLLRDCHVDYARESRRAMRCLISNNRFFSDCTAVCAIEYNARTCVRGRVEVLLCSAAGALPAGWCSPCCRRGWFFCFCR